MPHLTSRAAISHLPAVLIPAAVTMLVLYLRLPESAWPAYGSVYLCGVALVAVTLGWKDALVALVIGALMLDYFFLGPVDSLSLPTPDDWAVFLSFVLSGVLVAVAIEWRRASEKRLRIGIRLAQAQIDLAEARALASFRESPPKPDGGVAASTREEEGGPSGGELAAEVADTLDRSAAAMTALAATAPDEVVDAVRDEARRLGELAADVRATSALITGRSGAPGRDQPAFSQ